MTISTSSTNKCDSMSPSIKVIPNKKLYVSQPNPTMFGNPKNDPSWKERNWLKSRFHFSFAEYHNPKNADYGVLRVMNDDLVQPKRGFGSHPHRNMEIITYIVSGTLTHKDSMGTSESLKRGAVQFMTAGTGVMHSEHNLGDEPLRFIQTWVKPRAHNLAPNYGSYVGSRESRKNRLEHLVSDVKDTSVTTPVEVNQVVDAYAAEVELSKTVELELPPGKQAYLLCIEGEVSINGTKLEQYDGCEINGSGMLHIVATAVQKVQDGGDVAHILVFVMKEEPGSGRRD